MHFNRKQTAPAAKASERGYTFEPRYPDGTPIGATITVRGPESAAVRDLLRQQVREMQARETAGRRRGREAEPRSLEEMEAQAVELAVAYTVTWEGFVDDDVVLAPTETHLRAIYTDYSWIRRQVIEEAQDLGNFTQPASASCSSTPSTSTAST